MNPKQLIEAYVDDVVLLLPARQRKDVGIEQRELLYEGLSAKTEARGAILDEQTTRAFLKQFGAVNDVAARYRPAGNVMIPAREGANFAWLSVCGILFQWALSPPQEVLLTPDGFTWARFGAWAFGSAIHAFAFPGVMAVSALFWALFLRANSVADNVTLAFDGHLEPVAPIQPVEINRLVWGITIIGFAIAIPLYAAMPFFLAKLPEPMAHIYALDEGFVQARAPWLLLVWAAQLVLFIIVLVDGYWRPSSRRAEIALNLTGAAVLVWFYFGGPIAQTETTNQIAKIIIAGVALLICFVSAITFWREQARVGNATPK